jgi:NADP-dependent alcohol dehydrogenase
MLPFELRNPTKIFFGKGQIRHLPAQIPANARVLMVYGGGSIHHNGVYADVTEALKGINWQPFGGVTANPEYAVLMKALDLIRRERIDYLLAVGGGSVIDGVKFLAAAACYAGEEPWDILRKNIRTEVGQALPFGTVLTLPATGSEMNSGSVVSRAETGEKLSMGGPGLFPVFSILDPAVVHSIPQRQLANGVTDAFTHVLEQYATYPVGAALQDRIAESVMQTLIEVAPAVMENPADYPSAANFMWSCTMALNGLLSRGVPGDWAIHLMGHELTARFQIDHARTLAIILPGHYRYHLNAKQEKLAQYATRVWQVHTGTVAEKAEAAIEKTETFFHSLGIPTRLSAYTADFEGTAEWVAETFTRRGWTGIGEHRSLTPEGVAEIIRGRY